MMKEQLRVTDLCQKIVLGIKYIKKLFEGRNLLIKSFSFFSAENNPKIKVEDVDLKIVKLPDNSSKLRLSLKDGNIVDWFKRKFE